MTDQVKDPNEEQAARVSANDPNEEKKDSFDLGSIFNFFGKDVLMKLVLYALERFVPVSSVEDTKAVERTRELVSQAQSEG